MPAHYPGRKKNDKIFNSILPAGRERKKIKPIKNFLLAISRLETWSDQSYRKIPDEKYPCERNTPNQREIYHETFVQLATAAVLTLLDD